MNRSSPALAAALEYAERGWPVFPVGADKRPLTTHGRSDATREVAVIRGWFARQPRALVSIATGKDSGVVALDIDFGWGPQRLRYPGGAGDRVSPGDPDRAHASRRLSSALCVAGSFRQDDRRPARAGARHPRRRRFRDPAASTRPLLGPRAEPGAAAGADAEMDGELRPASEADPIRKPPKRARRSFPLRRGGHSTMRSSGSVARLPGRRRRRSTPRAFRSRVSPAAA